MSVALLFGERGGGGHDGGVHDAERMRSAGPRPAGAAELVGQGRVWVNRGDRHCAWTKPPRILMLYKPSQTNKESASIPSGQIFVSVRKLMFLHGGEKIGSSFYNINWLRGVVEHRRLRPEKK